MKIIADENIPYVTQAFGPLAQVVCCSGREMSAKTVASADALLVRSITKVNAELLDGSSVRFVGTATIGTDHIDLDYLNRNNITFTSAAGSNANSVAEYVITAILVLAQRFGWDLSSKSLGIIGLGNIGSKVKEKAKALGMRILCNDPPLQRLTHESYFLSLDDVLQADFVSCHVPLTQSCQDPTYHLFSQDRLNQLKPSTVLLNTSRGPVVDNSALKTSLAQKKIAAAVLDVWENEPAINTELLELIAIATPHIAGYSLDGKVNGTVMLRQALCEMINIQNDMHPADLLPPATIPEMQLDATAKTDQQLLTQAMTAVCDLLGDDKSLRTLAQLPADQHSNYFDQLRKNYPVRREAPNTLVRLTPANSCLADKLNLLGFTTDP